MIVLDSLGHQAIRKSLILCDIRSLLPLVRPGSVNGAKRDERHGRLSREVAVERCGSSRDTMERKETSDIACKAARERAQM
jgi:hypothetical protein